MGLFKNGVGRPSNETLKKRRIFYVALVAVLGLTVAFAALSTTLTINGQAKVNASSWDVHFEDLDLVEVNGNAVGNEVGDGENDAQIDISGILIKNLNAELKEPGDSVTYTTNIVNEGSIDAVVDIQSYFTNTLPDQLEVTAVYNDDEDITTTQKVLDAGQTLPVTITISYKDITDESLLLTEDETVDIQYVLVANQKTSVTTTAQPMVE